MSIERINCPCCLDEQTRILLDHFRLVLLVIELVPVVAIAAAAAAAHLEELYSYQGTSNLAGVFEEDVQVLG